MFCRDCTTPGSVTLHKHNHRHWQGHYTIICTKISMHTGTTKLCKIIHRREIAITQTIKIMINKEFL